MSTNKNTLGYLGKPFQLKLIGQLLTDNNFASSIIDIVKPEYFDDEKIRCIAMHIKNNHEQYNTIPDYVSLEIILKKTLNGPNLEHCLELLKRSKEYGFNNSEQIQDTAKTFFKQQETIKVAKKILEIAENGDINRYHECEDLIKTALEFGKEKDSTIDVFHDIEGLLSDDFRQVIPTGMVGVDVRIGGGLGKKELGIIIAPPGVGKTTAATIIANTAKEYGANVLQIFFEDLPKVIQRKHAARWSGVSLSEFKIPENKEKIRNAIRDAELRHGCIKLKKYDSGSVSIPEIKQDIKKLIADGFKPDLIIIDYIDCVRPSKHFTDNNIAEGNTMREFEALISELDCVGWTMTQGNRSSISAEVVQSDQVGGTVKKIHIGHLIISFAKTLQQKEDNTGTITILKSRFGPDGIVFKNCIFDNARVNIQTVEDDGGISFSKVSEVKEQDNQIKISAALIKSKMSKEKESLNLDNLN